MQLNKDGKRCVICDKDLARYWGRNLCEKCLREELRKDYEEKNKNKLAENGI